MYSVYCDILFVPINIYIYVHVLYDLVCFRVFCSSLEKYCDIVFEQNVNQLKRKVKKT